MNYNRKVAQIASEIIIAHPDTSWSKAVRQAESSIANTQNYDEANAVEALKLTHEEQIKLTKLQIEEMSREELEGLSLGYWELLMKQQAVLKNITLAGDDYSRAMAKGVLNGTLDVIID